MIRPKLRAFAVSVLALSIAIGTPSAQELPYYRNIHGGGSVAVTPPGNGGPPPGGGHNEPGGQIQILGSLPTEAMVGIPLLPANVGTTGGTAPIFLSIVGQPAGIDLSPQFSGTPLEFGSFNYTITATDSTAPIAGSATRTGSIVVHPPFTASVAGSLPQQIVLGQSAPSVHMSAAGGKAPYAFSHSGNLPSGMSLDTYTGLLTGSATTPGPYSFELLVSQAFPGGATYGSGLLTGEVIPEPLTFASTAPAGELRYGAAFASYGMTASGGTAPYAYSVASGALPTGVTLNENTGQLTGSATAGAFSFALRAVDSSTPQRSATTSVREGTIYQALVASGATQAIGEVGTPLPAGTVSASGGKAPYTYSINAMPANGVTFNASTGSFEGTPTGALTLAHTVTVTDALGTTASLPAQTLYVSSPISIPTASLPDATQSQLYNASLTVSGGRAPYTWTIPTTGSPEGFTYPNASTPTLGVTGVTSELGTRNLTFKVTDVDGRVAEKTLALNIVSGTPGAARSLIDTATYSPGSLSGDLAPYTILSNAGASGAPNAARTLAIARDETVYPVGQGGSSILKTFRRNENGVLFRVTYRFQSPVLISRIDQIFQGPEAPSGCTSAGASAAYETSNDGTNFTSLGSYNLAAGSPYKTSGSGYGGTVYNVTAPVSPRTAQYVRMTLSVNGFSNSCGSSSFNVMAFSGVVR